MLDCGRRRQSAAMKELESCAARVETATTREALLSQTSLKMTSTISDASSPCRITMQEFIRFPQAASFTH